jgi:hypothetical protein
MDKFIVELPDFVPPKLCEQIIKKFESDSSKMEGYMEYGMGDGSHVYRPKYNTQLAVDGSSEWREIDSDIHTCVKKAVLKYMECVKYNFDYNQKHHPLDRILNLTNMKDTGYCIQKIKKGDYFPWHFDGAIGSKLFIQIIIYLNTLDIEDGGRTEFPNGRSVKPDVGKILMFPCSWTFPHCGTKVKSDFKYICTTLVNADDPIVLQLSQSYGT